MLDFKRHGEYQHMKNCHFGYIQRKTDGAHKKATTVEILFFLELWNPLLTVLFIPKNAPNKT
jgi:hypothetical protein